MSLDDTLKKGLLDSLLRMVDEARAYELAERAAKRLNAWRVRWWTFCGEWPDEEARQAQILAGWPQKHRGGWPEFERPVTMGEVVTLASWRRRGR